MLAQQRLFARFLKDLKPGKLNWIGLRPARKQDMLVVDQVMALQDLGLEGDHRCDKTPGSARQVTLISQEYIELITHFSANPKVDAALLRRNLVVSGINLTALRHQEFKIGEAYFQATALCHPCSRMETAIGQGGVAAMLGHGGLCLKVLRSGQIKVGDALIPLAPTQSELF